jgi:phosphoribosylanthranilate isomerase
VIELADRAAVKAVQLHGHETPEATKQVHKSVRFVIKAFSAGSPTLEKAADYDADVVMIDSATPGSGRLFDWKLVDQAPLDARILLAGGLTPENVATAIERVHPWGVDVSSGVEREPGRKDPVRMKDFIEAARAAAPIPYRGPDVMPYDWADE